MERSEESANPAEATSSAVPGGQETLTSLPPQGSPFEVLWVALRLGLTSFGGPIAHLGYFRNEYVVRRQWLNEPTYADVVALCQFLPGPASSQVGIIVGIVRAGLPGGLFAWLAFTLPSAVALVIFGYGVQQFDVSGAAWLHGLKVVAVAVVAQAVWGMSRSLAPDRERATIAILATIAALAWQTAIGQILIIVVAGIIGWRLLPAPSSQSDHISLSTRIPTWLAITSLVLFFALLGGLPLARQIEPSQWLALFDSFFRVGSLVFGGGHVVLPLLQSEVVGPGWLTNEQFVAGYGAAQAVPGPLFTFSAYLGTMMQAQPNGVAGAGLALVAIFLPSFLLIIGVLPFWDVLRRRPALQSSLGGINAAVVGLLLAALYSPVWTNAIESPTDFGLAIVALGLLVLWKWPPWLVVISTAGGSEALAALARL